jgi:transcriptional regulator with XRE-family HTH domain/quercetin dioxygenase-like cupin family protein
MRMSPPAAGSAPSGSLGGRLRQARLDSRKTVRELARQLGVSASFISQLENGKSQPSVATLYSLAQVLHVPIEQLFQAQGSGPRTAAPSVETAGGADPESAPPTSDTASDPTDPINRGELVSPATAWQDQQVDPARLSVTTPADRTRLVMDCNVTWDQLVRKTDHLDFMEITYPPGSSSTTDGRMLRHDDYEYGYLLEGELEVTLGFDVFTLKAGEAMGFDSSTPHLFRNLGSTPARGVWVVHHRHE